MEIIADLHVHSRFARAVSKSLNLEELETWGLKKGNHLIGAPDFTHPVWRKEMEEELEPVGNGFFQRRNSMSAIQFVLSVEISCIFSRKGKTYRTHMMIHAPSFEDVEKIVATLSWVGKLKSDGRPIIGMDVQELCKAVLQACPEAIVYPAHVWTPWFSLFGSKSGFDSFAECFGEYSDHIPSVETGLSSDPAMNWRLSQLDGKTILSGSDAHSAKNMGREATVLELEEPSYQNLRDALFMKNAKNHIVSTIEFYPEEGMYHWDGHRNCNVRWSPKETEAHGGTCTKCGKEVTVGVENRVEELADRPEGYQPNKRPPFYSLIPLQEIIAEVMGVGKLTKTVEHIYEPMIERGGDEFSLLLKTPIDEIANLVEHPKIAEAILRVRERKVNITPGYDGTYGIVKVFGEDEQMEETKQKSLF